MDIMKYNLTSPKLMIIVSYPEQESQVLNILSQKRTFGISAFTAMGLSPASVMELLGLNDNHKALVMCLVEGQDVEWILTQIKEKIYKKRATGISLVVNVDGFIGLRSMLRLSLLAKALDIEPHIHEENDDGHHELELKTSQQTTKIDCQDQHKDGQNGENNEDDPVISIEVSEKDEEAVEQVNEQQADSSNEEQQKTEQVTEVQDGDKKD